MAVVSSEQRAKLNNANYLLAIKDSGAPLGVPGNAVAPDGYFGLPVPPQSINPQQKSRHQLHHHRQYSSVSDLGLDAPQWQLKGRFLFSSVQVASGAASQQQLMVAFREFIRFYFEENVRRAQAQTKPVTMEWFDFYQEEYWQVVPADTPMGQRSSVQPTSESYEITLIGVKPLASPDPQPDPVEIILNEPPASVAQGLV